MYNSLPHRIKQCDRLKIFKRGLKEYILNIIFLVILIDSIISLFLLRFAFFASCIFVFYILWFYFLFFAFCILYFVFENS